MATRPQHSKRDRGRAHVGLPPKQAQASAPVSARVCPDCAGYYWNLQAHVEECPGPQDWTGWYGVSGLCSCGWRRDGGRCVHGNPYVPVFRVTRATEAE